MSDLPIPRIEVRRSRGKTGAFGPVATVWNCILVGVDGTTRDGGSAMNEGYGSRDKSYPITDAAHWHRFTGWPVVHTRVRVSSQSTIELEKP